MPIERHPNIWPPFTNLAKEPLPLKVKSAKGAYFQLEDGRKVFDAISSWWTNIHGHGHPKLVEAIANQVKTLDHVLFAGISHDPAERLAEKLCSHLPPSLNRVFYSDNGSTANEVALKMALQYWQNIGQKRTRFIAFEGAYHGDTFGAMSVGGPSVFNTHFKDHFFEVDFIPYPDTWQGDTEVEEKEEQVIELLEQILIENEDQVAAIIIEPLIQGAGGMRMCRTEFLQKLHWTQRQFDTLLIFDEVMTGFGRTGNLFALEKAQVTPDLLCLSKGLSGGTLPLAATVVSDVFYQHFIDASDPLKTFYHGHSYTANPIACASGIASLKLLELSNENGHKSFEASAVLLNELFNHLASHPKLRRPRRCGNVVAFDLKDPVSTNRYLADVGFQIKKLAPDQGILIRPLGNCFYLLPPYCIDQKDVDLLIKGIHSILSKLS